MNLINYLKSVFAMNKKINDLAILIFFTLSIISCSSEGIVDNPPAFLEITAGPNENEVVDKDKVAFTWRGSGTDYLFRYRLMTLDKDNFPSTYLDWSTYGGLNEVSFTYLDDGKYRFELQGKSSGIEPAPIKRDFYIDGVKGPALLFNKVKTNMKFNTIDSVSIWMEDIDSLVAFQVVISFDKSKLQLIRVSGGSYVQEKRFNQVIVPDYNSQSVLNQSNSLGRIDFSSAFLMDLGSYPNKFISGSGKIAVLVFKTLSRGTTTLDMTSIELRNAKGKSILYSIPKSGVVVIE